MTVTEHAIEIARAVRADLLRCSAMPRNLAGQCGLVALRVANALGEPRALRTGFFMARGEFCGKRGRAPHRHAWCRIGPTIIDATATQFGRSLPAVLVAVAVDDDRYIETADSTDAIDDILIKWRGRELPEYKRLAKSLRRRCA